MEDKPSERIIDQRIRNRIMEALDTLASGADGVSEVWPDEYFESFYDWIPHRDDGEMRSNSALSEQELTYLREVSKTLDDACDATPKIMTADELIATGWPQRIQLIAQRALTHMVQRGRFSEDMEEAEPSSCYP